MENMCFGWHTTTKENIYVFLYLHNLHLLIIKEIYILIYNLNCCFDHFIVWHLRVLWVVFVSLLVTANYLYALSCFWLSATCNNISYFGGSIIELKNYRVEVEHWKYCGDKRSGSHERKQTPSLNQLYCMYAPLV